MACPVYVYRSTLSRSVFKSWIFFLTFCAIDLCGIVSGMLKSPTIIVQESKSFCWSLRTGFMDLGAPALGAYVFRIVSSSCCIDPFSVM